MIQRKPGGLAETACDGVKINTVRANEGFFRAFSARVSVYRVPGPCSPGFNLLAPSALRPSMTKGSAGRDNWTSGWRTHLGPKPAVVVRLSSFQNCLGGRRSRLRRACVAAGIGWFVHYGRLSRSRERAVVRGGGMRFARSSPYHLRARDISSGRAKLLLSRRNLALV